MHNRAAKNFSWETAIQFIEYTHYVGDFTFNKFGIISVTRIFDWGGGLNHKSHAMTSSEIFKKKFFVGQRYRRMEDLKLQPCWH